MDTTHRNCNCKLGVFTSTALEQPNELSDLPAFLGQLIVTQACQLLGDVYGRPEMTAKRLDDFTPVGPHMFCRNGGQGDVVSTYWAELGCSPRMESRENQLKRNKLPCQSREVDFELRPFP